jgi:hypothetical protein
MIVGVIGGLLSMMFWSTWGGFNAGGGGGDVVVERDRPRTTVVERERRV